MTEITGRAVSAELSPNSAPTSSSKTRPDPLLPPQGSRSIDEILADARSNLKRLTAVEAFNLLTSSDDEGPKILVDIRPVAQRHEEGSIEGAIIVERNVLEWRMDPRSDSRLDFVNQYDLKVVVFCSEGYTSSLAARSLQELGLSNATDIVGGFKAWKRAKLGGVRSRLSAL
ncbi:hypothetical protein BP6252_09037 [Coleophoma cylindrospora]|uniref:Rhodanese domain-containing protein n=1 Tax=Coleophoma cylindrospora TaxID=1849047 RepID=A0A3D8R150_9HELO|nr:hypothetical protein BP6252_09037 [Coleophoma cylindrospora]